MEKPFPTTILKQLSPVGLNPTYQAVVRKFNTFCEQHAYSDDLISLFLSEMFWNNSIATVKMYKSALKKAMRNKLTGSNADTMLNIAILDCAFKDMKTGSVDLKIRKEKTLSVPELEHLVSVSGLKTGLIIKALYETAARVSELVNIRLSDCAKTDTGICIRVKGKGRKERTFYMMGDTFEAIREAYQGKVYLFETHERCHLSRRTVHTLIKRVGVKIGRPDIHAHTLRHSFATNRLPDLGIDAVSSYLGHSSPEITAKFYLHKSATIEEILMGVSIGGSNTSQS